MFGDVKAAEEQTTALRQSEEPEVDSPVPKPSIPGISSPKLRGKTTITTLMLVVKPVERASGTYPWIPFFGGLLLN